MTNGKSSAVLRAAHAKASPSVAELPLRFEAPTGVGESSQNGATETPLESVQSRLPYLTKVFRDFTNLSLESFCHSPEQSNGKNDSPLCPTARRLVAAGEELPVFCQACVIRQWHASEFVEAAERRIQGACGLTTVSMGLLTTADQREMTFLLQALVVDDSAGMSATKMARTASSGPLWKRRRTRGREIGARAFRRAESLLRIIVEGLQAELRAELLENQQHAATKALDALDVIQIQQQPGYTDMSGDQRHDLEKLASNTRKVQRVVEEMCEFVRHHYHRPMSLKELALHLDMHPNYLSDLFRKSMGVPFHTYLETRRIGKAKELLRKPGVKVTRVALSVGYDSPNHFRKVFRAREGVSPSAWTCLPQNEHREAC